MYNKTPCNHHYEQLFGDVLKTGLARIVMGRITIKQNESVVRCIVLRAVSVSTAY